MAPAELKLKIPAELKAELMAVQNGHSGTKSITNEI